MAYFDPRQIGIYSFDRISQAETFHRTDRRDLSGGLGALSGKKSRAMFGALIASLQSIKKNWPQVNSILSQAASAVSTARSTIERARWDIESAGGDGSRMDALSAAVDEAEAKISDLQSQVDSLSIPSEIATWTPDGAQPQGQDWLDFTTRATEIDGKLNAVFAQAKGIGTAATNAARQASAVVAKAQQEAQRLASQEAERLRRQEAATLAEERRILMQQQMEERRQQAVIDAEQRRIQAQIDAENRRAQADAQREAQRLAMEQQAEAQRLALEQQSLQAQYAQQAELARLQAQAAMPQPSTMPQAPPGYAYVDTQTGQQYAPQAQPAAFSPGAQPAYLAPGWYQGEAQAQQIAAQGMPLDIGYTMAPSFSPGYELFGLRGLGAEAPAPRTRAGRMARDIVSAASPLIPGQAPAPTPEPEAPALDATKVLTWGVAGYLAFPYLKKLWKKVAK